jgi:hypothetical protein
VSIDVCAAIEQFLNRGCISFRRRVNQPAIGRCVPARKGNRNQEKHEHLNTGAHKPPNLRTNPNLKKNPKTNPNLNRCRCCSLFLEDLDSGRDPG